MNIAHPGCHAFSNILHREMIISVAIAKAIITRTIASPHSTAHANAPIPIIAS